MIYIVSKIHTLLKLQNIFLGLNGIMTAFLAQEHPIQEVWLFFLVNIQIIKYITTFLIQMEII